jgi:hypothetical protein
MANTQLHNLLQKEVSRKEFLGIMGLALCSILGFGHILELLTGKSLGKHSSVQQSNHSNVIYGGQKD